MKRNGYIDFVKFFFAIVVAEFHLGTGIFSNGRIAVDGFFMISGYLMMRTIYKNPCREGEIGISGAKFILRKYKSLFVFLLPSVIISSIANAISRGISAVEYLKNLPLLIFEIIPLNTAGFKGWYVIGISWYISSMFIALAILYPLMQKLKSSGEALVCPMIALIGYGILSAFYGSIAVGSSFIEGTVIHSGWVRALAGCSFGCVIYAIHKKLAEVKLGAAVKWALTAAEWGCFAFVVICMHGGYFVGKYDYVAILVLFFALTLGISGVTYTSTVMNPKWTSFFGTASTLIVLNHYCWLPLLKSLLTTDTGAPEFIISYIVLTAVSSALVWLLGWGIKRILSLAVKAQGKETVS